MSPLHAVAQWSYDLACYIACYELPFEVAHKENGVDNKMAAKQSGVEKRRVIS